MIAARLHPLGRVRAPRTVVLGILILIGAAIAGSGAASAEVGPTQPVPSGQAPAADDPRPLLETQVRHALAGALRDGRAVAFAYRIGATTPSATVRAADDAQLTLVIDVAVIRSPWRDLPDRELHALGAAVLADGREKHFLLGMFAYRSGALDLARADFAKLKDAGGRLPPEAGRLDEKRIEDAHAHREQLAAAAWERLAPLLADPAKRDDALSALSRFEAAWDGTDVMLAKGSEIARARERLRAAR